MTSFIEQYESYLSPTICEQACILIDEAITRNQTIYTDVPGRKDYKLSSNKYEEFKQVESHIFDAVYKGWKYYNSKFEITGEKFENIFTPDWNFQKSMPGGGFTGWHTEQTNSKGSQARFAVWMIYLNTLTTSGTTDFKEHNLSIYPSAGTLVIWPAGFTHVHRASPNLESNKYIATGWFSYQ